MSIVCVGDASEIEVNVAGNKDSECWEELWRWTLSISIRTGSHNFRKARGVTRECLLPGKEIVKCLGQKTCARPMMTREGNGLLCRSRKKARSCPNGAKILQIHRDGLPMTRDGVTDACPNTPSGSSPTDADQSGHAADVELELQSSGTRDLQLGVTGAFSRMLTTAAADITANG